MKYSITKGLKKSIITVLLVGIPMILQILPQEWQNLTLGGLLVLLHNYIKFTYIK